MCSFATPEAFSPQGGGLMTLIQEGNSMKLLTEELELIVRKAGPRLRMISDPVSVAHLKHHLIQILGEDRFLS
jgi:hypothetical protein